MKQEKQNHTQGEWKASNRIFLHVEIGDQWICQLSNLENTNKNFLSDEYDAEERRLKEEQQANARLIAAAPDLLHALQTLVNWASNGNQEHLIVFEQAQQAIDKATTNINNKIN